MIGSWNGSGWSEGPTPEYDPVDHRTGADERFRAAAISTLEGEGVDASVGQVVQSVRADLDGDGDIEEFVVYEYLDDDVRSNGDPRSFTPGVAGEFSVVALADTD